MSVVSFKGDFFSFYPEKGLQEGYGIKAQKAVKKPVVVHYCEAPCEVSIETKEGTMIARKGDIIIRGVQGELYPCKPDIFKATYNVANT